MGHDIDSTESGGPIYRHQPTVRTYQAIDLDQDTRGALAVHGELHLGGKSFVWREIVSDKVRIDLHLHAPTPTRNFWVITTRGMSARPMSVPAALYDERYAELVIGLPPNWPVSEIAFEREEYFWPLRWLKTLARLPHDYQSWLGVGHTVPTAETPHAYAPNTTLCCAFLVRPSRLGEAFSQVCVNETKVVHFLSFVPIYREEMEFKLRFGADALSERLHTNKIDEILDVHRRIVI